MNPDKTTNAKRSRVVSRESAGSAHKSGSDELLGTKGVCQMQNCEEHRDFPDPNCHLCDEEREEAAEEKEFLLSNGYCATCAEPEHDSCSLTLGCPCCEETAAKLNAEPLILLTLPDNREYAGKK